MKNKLIEQVRREIRFRIWFNEPSAPSQMIYTHIDDFIIDEDKNVIGQVFLLNSYQKGFEVNYKVVNLKEGLLKDEIMSLDDTWWDADNSVLMQYTGLKDKNGIELYEGDVVLFDNSTLHNLIEYSEGRFYGTWQSKWNPVENEEITGMSGRTDWFKWEGGLAQSQIITRSPNFTILGNKYENPELLVDDQTELKEINENGI